MNERIKLLAEQAHSYACEYAQQPDYNPHNPYNQSMYKQRYDSKFAELIVKECIGCCEQVISDPVPKSVDTWLNGGEQCIQEIKQHFGV